MRLESRTPLHLMGTLINISSITLIHNFLLEADERGAIDVNAMHRK